jgi:hypothetical protein
MNLDYLRGFCQKKIAEHPDLKIAILELYWLAKDEMQEGASVSNEVGLAIESINQLIEENK